MLMKNKLNLIIIFVFVFTNVNAANLNYLFEKLAVAKNVLDAEIIEQKIWEKWTQHPESEYLTKKLENATFSMNHQQYQIALKLFTDIINEDPNWAEGWNKRATLLFIIGNYEDSLSDIEQVLKIEPRHFGALSGRAQIYLSKKQYEKALEDLERARKIYPLIKSDKSIKFIRDLIKELQI
tara:strand:- start:23 stop:565 length:543 start_codon:yes stop_codon:yes gene_type:complete